MMTQMPAMQAAILPQGKLINDLISGNSKCRKMNDKAQVSQSLIERAYHRIVAELRTLVALNGSLNAKMKLSLTAAGVEQHEDAMAEPARSGASD